jgi:DNA-binding MarR family transcriptional regulator
MISSMRAASDPFRHQGDELHLLREVVRTHQVLMATISRAIGIPASRFALMRLVATSEDGAGVMDLAAQLGINAAAVTRQLKDMERKGLVRRRMDARDGRRNYLSLSVKGMKLFAELHERSHELERALVDNIGAQEMSAAADVLVKLRNFVGRMSNERSSRNAFQ